MWLVKLSAVWNSGQDGSGLWWDVRSQPLRWLFLPLVPEQRAHRGIVSCPNLKVGTVSPTPTFLFFFFLLCVGAVL